MSTSNQLFCMILSQNDASTINNKIIVCFGDLITLECTAVGAETTINYLGWKCCFRIPWS